MDKEKDELPEHYWHDRDLLLTVLDDRDCDDWKRVREESEHLVSIDGDTSFLDAIILEDAREYRLKRNRKLMERVVRRLLWLKGRHGILGVLDRKLAEVASLGPWLRSNGKKEPLEIVEQVFHRACDVARWILNAKMSEIKKLQIDAALLSLNITELETDPGDQSALRKVRIAQRLISECLPLPRRDRDNTGKTRPNDPQPIPYPGDVDQVGVLTDDGFCIHRGTEIIHQAVLPKRLLRLLVAAWASGWSRFIDRSDCEDSKLNEPAELCFYLRELRGLVGTCASRTNVSALRRYLQFPDGRSLITDGIDRIAMLDFCVYDAERPADQTLRAYLRRFLERHGVKLPSCSRRLPSKR